MPNDLLQHHTPPIPADLLGFGVGVFQAALLGDLPAQAELEPGDALAHLGIQALQHEIEGHGLSSEQETSLMFRVLAFSPLLEIAAVDPRTQHHVRAVSEGFEVSERFVQAAASCRLEETPDGAFRYDMDSLVRELDPPPPRALVN